MAARPQAAERSALVASMTESWPTGISAATPIIPIEMAKIEISTSNRLTPRPAVSPKGFRITAQG